MPVLRLSYKELPVDLTMGDAEDCGSVDDAISSILAAGPRARQLVCLVKARLGFWWLRMEGPLCF